MNGIQEGIGLQGGLVKNLADFHSDYIFALLFMETLRGFSGKATEYNAALVNRLRRLPFTEE